MTTRRLAAILAADVVGFSSFMGQDEEGTLARIKSLRREVIEPKVQEHHGRVFKTTGDGLLVEFPSPVEAVRCAVESRRPSLPKPLRSRPRPSSSASASTWATSSSRKTRMCMETALTSRRGWNNYRNPAAASSSPHDKGPSKE